MVYTTEQESFEKNFFFKFGASVTINKPINFLSSKINFFILSCDYSVVCVSYQVKLILVT